ncbi:hypothetical protein RUM43_012830 [Polyplax serrata]|uniref:Protein Skeletor n=1 Tax=Polyplax serrata TaxID=468196 RepID=A0AAN8S439_POLSC
MNKIGSLVESVCLLSILLFISDVQGEEEGPYRGKYLGKLNSYHHQVSGDVYAVDDYTLLLIQFSYDGNGADTFFWAGASNRPGPQGFIVPDEHGKTNVLERYFNKDLTITLPDKKKITEIKWFAVYDLSSQVRTIFTERQAVVQRREDCSFRLMRIIFEYQRYLMKELKIREILVVGLLPMLQYGERGDWKTEENLKKIVKDRKPEKVTVNSQAHMYNGRQNAFGDVYIPEEFEPPVLQKISQLSSKSHGVKSSSFEVVDSKTIRLTEFSYDGTASQAYFWVGVGPQPSSKGFKVPDEYGLNPLRAYKEQDVTLELPGELTIFDIDWFSIYDLENKENFGSVIVPDGLNVPPSLVEVLNQKSGLPNCHQLHKNYRVSWEIFGPQITIQLAGQLGEDDYMAFGLSGSQEKSQMLGADVTIAYIDSFRGYATDYNITGLAPCSRVLGQYKGVCRDDMVGGMDNNQLFTSTREDGINIVTYRRTLISSDSGDKPYPTDGPAYVVWAMGRLDHRKEPSFHDYYLKSDLLLELNKKEPENNCFAFTRSRELYREPWEKNEIFDRTIRSYTATIGPSGGKRGYQGMTGMTANALAWYINGKLIPELWMRRGLTYSFKVFGGNNPHSAETYHPLIITTEPHGGLETLTEPAQRQIRVLAGVEYTRRGHPRPTAAGPLCISVHDKRDRRLDDDFETFKRFNRSLVLTCEKGDPAILEVTPNSSWPDVVYYHSFTHSNMGWKVHIVDNLNTRDSASTLILRPYSSTVIIGICIFLYLR